MLRLSVTGLLSLILSASVGAAQNEASGDGGFCATAPQDLLVALDGNWSLTQAAGSMLGMTNMGQIVVPLPPHPPKAVQLEYDPDQGLMIMSSQGQQVLMIPTMAAVDELPEILSSALGHRLESEASPSGCDWFALPTILGTNTYVLRGSTGGTTPRIATAGGRGWAGISIIYCAIDAIDGRELVFAAGVDGSWEAYDSDGDVASDSSMLGCARPIESAGDMIMKIAVKFDSPSSGRGVISFEGELDGATWTGGASITMSR